MGSKRRLETLNTDDDNDSCSPCIVSRWRLRSCFLLNRRPQVLHSKRFDFSLSCVAMCVLRLCFLAEASEKSKPIINANGL